jgi:hypothetical protein
MIIFIGVFVLLLNIGPFLVSKDTVLFTCIGAGFTFFSVRDYFPFKTFEFNETLKYTSFFIFFNSFFFYCGKLLYSFFKEILSC